MKQYVNEIQKNDEVKDVFYLNSIEQIQGNNNKMYLALELSDKTGSIKAKMWDNSYSADKVNEILVLAEGFVAVSGKGSEYNGTYITVTELRAARENEYNATDFFPSYAAGKIDEARKKLELFINSIQKPHIKALLKDIFYSKHMKIKFFKCQGGKQIHHVAEGGLAVHTIAVTDIVEFFISLEEKNSLYSYPVDRDICIAAALLHDIGKVKEYIPFPQNERSLCGYLQGHIQLSYAMVYHKIYSLRDNLFQAKEKGTSISKEDEAIWNFPKEDEAKLLHCILASHGADGPMTPACKEAEILSRADNMDSGVNGIDTAVFQDNSSSEFTQYNKWYNTRIYKK